jgi:hypothetical protein
MAIIQGMSKEEWKENRERLRQRKKDEREREKEERGRAKEEEQNRKVEEGKILEQIKGLHRKIQPYLSDEVLGYNVKYFLLDPEKKIDFKNPKESIIEREIKFFPFGDKSIELQLREAYEDDPTYIDEKTGKLYDILEIHYKPERNHNFKKANLDEINLEE